MTAFVGPLFIVGMPRSGTKLLRNLLNRHPRVKICSIETGFLPYLCNKNDSFGDLQESEAFKRFYNHITKLPYFDYLRRADKLLSSEQWRSNCRSYDPAGLFEAIIRAQESVPYESSVIWGDKSPSYIRHISLLHRIYPKARTVHLVRDVRDYCLSINSAWGKNIFRAAKRWSEGVLAARATGDHLENAYVDIRYEELIQRTESVLRHICNFIDIEFDPAMTTLASAVERDRGPTSTAQVIGDNYNKFIGCMAKSDCMKIEEFALKGMRQFGYEPLYASAARRSTPIEDSWWLASDALNLLRSERRKRGLLLGAHFHIRHFQQIRGAKGRKL